MVSLVIFSAGVVSAEDNATYSDENYELNTVALDDGAADTSQENTSDLVRETADTQQIGDFSKLQNAIAQGGDIYMNNSYYNFTTSINITKDCNIYGGTSSNPQGGAMATCDGQNKYQLFNINNGNIIVNFYYINMINGKTTEGGAITCSGSVTPTSSGSVTTTNCNFINNTATNSGGAIHSTDTVVLTVTNCNFINNNAKDGGAIHSNGPVTANNCTFTNNNANIYASGGAIHSNGPVTANNCTFTNNNANNHGGAIHTSKSVTATNCTFTNNKAKQNNGGAINSNGIVTATNCTFTNNTATGSYINNGGAICTNSGSVTATNCTFTNNKANNGGAIYSTGSVNMTNCVFVNNTGTFGYNAIYCSNGFITDCFFEGNQVRSGDGIVVGIVSNANVLDSNLVEISTNSQTWRELEICNMTLDVKVESNSVSIIVNVPSNATGDVTIKTDDKIYVVKPIDGKVEIALHDVTPGNHKLTAIYKDNNYYAKNNTAFIVKDNATMIVAVENNIITVSVPKNATGNVIIKVDDGEDIVRPIVEGKVEMVLPDSLKPGNHNVTVIYNGDDYYNPTEANTTFIIKDNATMIVAVENNTITVTLPKNATGNITIKIDNKIYAIKPIVNGKVEIPLSDLNPSDYNKLQKRILKTPKRLGDLAPGDHNLTVIYSGDDYYNPAEVNTTFIIKDNATMDITVENNTITVTLPENATGNVTIKIDDNEYVVKPIVDGKVEMVLPDSLKPGNHNVTIIYNGDDYYNPTEANTTFIIKDNTTMDITVENNTITVSVPKNATGNVTIKVDDDEYVVKPIVDGKVEVALPDDLKPGNHNLTIIYNGDDYYNPTEANTTFIIKDNVTMVITVENETITVILPENATGSVTLVVDGMTPMLLPHVPGNYELVNGTVKVPFEGLEPGTHNVTAIYNGDDYYNPTEANTTFIIKDNTTMDITVENNTITVTLPENATGNVTIKIDNDEYVVRPIVDGKVEVALPSDLKPGNHNVTVIYNGDDYHNPAEANTTFIVKDNITGLIDVKVENNTIIVSVPENTTGNITIKIDNDEDIVRPIVDGKVEVALPSDLKPGNHKITIIYNGDDYHNLAEVNTTFVVKDNATDVIDNNQTINESTVEQNTTIMLPKNEATTSTLKTGNPIALLILSICLLIPLRRLKK